MIGDVLLLAEKHQRLGKRIFQRLQQMRTNGKFIVSIGGESGSGKSELAHVLRSLLKQQQVKAKILHTDNYYKVPPAQRTAWRQQHGIARVGLDEYDWAKIAEHLVAFRQGQEAQLPFIDIVTDQIDRLCTSFQEIEVLVLEGLYALNAQADLKVFIDLSYHQTKHAQVTRGKEPQTQFRAQILEREHVVVQSLKAQADMVVAYDE